MPLKGWWTGVALFRETPKECCVYETWPNHPFSSRILIACGWFSWLLSLELSCRNSVSHLPSRALRIGTCWCLLRFSLFLLQPMELSWWFPAISRHQLVGYNHTLCPSQMFQVSLPSRSNLGLKLSCQKTADHFQLNLAEASNFRIRMQFIPIYLWTWAMKITPVCHTIVLVES